MFNPIQSTFAVTQAHEVQPAAASPPLDDKFVLSNGELIVVLVAVITGLLSGLVYVFAAGLNDKKELTAIINENKKLSDLQIDNLREKLQDKADSLVSTINSLNNSTIQIAQKMDLFITKANELEKQLDRHEQTLTKRIDTFEKRVDLLDRQSLVLFTYVQRLMRSVALNESVLVDVQLFLENALIEVADETNAELKKRPYRRSKCHIDPERMEDIKNLVSEYNGSRLSVYPLTQLTPNEEEEYLR